MTQSSLEISIFLLAGHEIFVRIVTSAGALSAGVPDSDNKTPSRSSRLGGSIFSE